MPIRSPREPVYYYECSGGTFRLVYFIPPDDLATLQSEGKISDQVLRDFPDGVDLACTEDDYGEFHGVYKWRPPVDPESIRRAFFAIWSSTRGWKTFWGTGMIPARDIENHVPEVEAELARKKVTRAPPRAERSTVAQRRRERGRDVRGWRALEKMVVPRIDPKRDLRRQVFSQIRMGGGEPAEEVFSRVHEKRRRSRGR